MSIRNIIEEVIVQVVHHQPLIHQAAHADLVRKSVEEIIKALEKEKGGVHLHLIEGITRETEAKLRNQEEEVRLHLKGGDIKETEVDLDLDLDLKIIEEGLDLKESIQEVVPRIGMIIVRVNLSLNLNHIVDHPVKEDSEVIHQVDQKHLSELN